MADTAVGFLNFAPGIKRDGTQFDSDKCINAQWTRFYRGKPIKMGGYKLIDPGTSDIVRELFVVDKGNLSVDIYYGVYNSLTVNNFDSEGNLQDSYDRTPTDPSFVPNPNNIWDFDLFSFIDSDNNPHTYIIASCIPNGADINNQIGGGIFYGDINSTGPLEPVTSPNQLTTGGICTVGDFVFSFGNKGIAQWSKNGDPLTWPTQNINAASNTKLVQGYATWGGNTLSVLLWSLNSLEKGVFTPITENENLFTFTTVQPNISILSARSVVKYDEDTFLWVGISEFYIYTGVVNTIPNNDSIKFFFNNLNQQYREKVFSVIVTTTSKEWQIHFPFGDSVENNHMIYYNIEEKTWGDCAISRAAGSSASINLPYPIFSDAVLTLNKADIPFQGIPPTPPTGAPPPPTPPLLESYPIWMHEFGYDKIMYGQTYAITSYFETPLLTYYEQNPQDDRNLRIRDIQPDFIVSGNMTVTVNKRAYPNSPVISSTPFSFNSSTPKIDMNEQGGLISLLFESNEAGGYFEMGKVAYSYAPGDARRGS